MKSKVKLGQVMKKKTAKASAVELSGKKPNVAEKSSSKKKSNLPKVVPPIEDESDAEDDEMLDEDEAASSGSEEMAKLDGEGSLNGDEDPSDDDDSEGSEAPTSKKASQHKMDLKRIMQQDPEFYEFLKNEEADLLNFNDSDGEDEQDDEEEEPEEETSHEEKVKKSQIPKAKKDSSSGRLIFDGALFDYLQEALDPEDEKKRGHYRGENIRLAVEAFSACVARVGANIEPPKYIINDEAVFESTVRLCFSALPTAFNAIASGKIHGGVKGEDAEPIDEDDVAAKKRRSKHLKKFQAPIKTYLQGVLLFLNEVQTPVVIVSTLKAVLRLLDLFSHYLKIARGLVKVLVRIWTRKPMNCRITAYICMNQLVKQHREHFVYLYKSAYLGYVSNSREVTNETWSLLQFMQRTFAELTMLAPDLAYQYVFVYIRQTAIHLRNAMISKKRKDLVQTIYNWQLIQCLYLWVRVVSLANAVGGAESIAELDYPLAQVISGVEKLYPSSRYLPLRLHCIRLLVQLEANCNRYIPTLAMITELFPDYVRLHSSKPKIGKGAGGKDADMECMLKFTPTQMDDSAFRAAACDHLFRTILQAAQLMAGQASYPDMIYPVTIRLRAFAKQLRAPDHCRQFKELAEKLEEHGKFVSNTLSTLNVDLRDEIKMLMVKHPLKNPDAPLRVYYRQWEKVWKLRAKALRERTTITTESVEADKKKQKAEKNKKKVVEAEKKSAKKEEADDDVVKIEKPKPKRVRLALPNVKPDATVPDTVSDLAGGWSDED